jgi:hypothetical protein
MFTKLHKALNDVILDIDEEGYEADRFLKNLGISMTDSDTDEEAERYSQLTGTAILIILIDIILGFELKSWIGAVKMVLKYGL